MNIYVQVFGGCVLILLAYIPNNGIAGSYGKSAYSNLVNAKLFFKVTKHCIPTRNEWVFHFLHNLVNTYLLSDFWLKQS